MSGVEPLLALFAGLSAPCETPVNLPLALGLRRPAHRLRAPRHKPGSTSHGATAPPPQGEALSQLARIGECRVRTPRQRRQQRVLVQSQMLRIDGHLEAADGVRHEISCRLTDLTPLLIGLDVHSRDFRR